MNLFEQITGKKHFNNNMPRRQQALRRLGRDPGMMTVDAAGRVVSVPRTQYQSRRAAHHIQDYWAENKK